MNPEFEDEKIRLWRELEGQGEQLRDDPTVLNIETETEEIFESRAYGLGSSAREQLREAAGSLGLPEGLALELGGELSFKFIAKRRRADGLVAYVLVFVGPDERHLLGREDWITEERFRESVAQFEAAVLPEGLVQQPLVVSLDEWRRYGGPQGPT